MASPTQDAQLSSVRIRPYPFNSQHAHDIVQKLDEEVGALYPGLTDEHSPYPNVKNDATIDTITDDDDENASLVFILASTDGMGMSDIVAVGSIALRPLPAFPSHELRASSASASAKVSTAEIKRMYIAPSFRRTGLASRLLAYAEEYARDVMCVHRLVLETGMRQYAAVKLYERHGFERTDVFGDYVGEGVEDGGISLCFEKCIVAEKGAGWDAWKRAR